MIDRQIIEEAITVLRWHRPVLGDAVVQTAVAALQEKLDTLSDENGRPPRVRQLETAVALQADLSGFTALSSGRDAEQVRDTVNALWQRLDKVVAAWGGSIDKHTGDGLIALFGVEEAQDDDATRAVQAALDMQAELVLFNAANQRRPDTGALESRSPLGELHMRIGVHCGPVMLARVGASSEVTAVGETISLTEQVEKAAPVDRILISQDVYRRVYNHFEIDPQQPLWLTGRSEPLEVFVVVREKSRARHPAVLPAPRFVARVAEQDRLQFAFQETLDNGVMQVVTVEGAAGLGKSRLVAEFLRWLALLPVQGSLLYSQADELAAAQPYALLRDLFRQLFNIHWRSSTAVNRQKFVQGVQRIGRADASSAREQAHVMGQLLGFDFADSPYLTDLLADPTRLKTYAFNDLARFFTDLAEGCPPVVWVVENSQWADDASLDLIEFLLAERPELPLLLICLARPEFLAKRPSWRDNTPFNPRFLLTLPPLSPIDTRHLITDMSGDPAQLPPRLLDLVVHGAQGNPLYAVEMVRLLIERQVISRSGDRWQVNLSQLAEMPLPETLAGLYAARLEMLPAVERLVVQTAVLCGPQFWDEAVQFALLEESSFPVAELPRLLAALEQRQLIFRCPNSHFSGAKEYRFSHDAWRQGASPPRSDERRQRQMARLAHWVERQSPPGDAPWYDAYRAYLRQRAPDGRL